MGILHPKAIYIIRVWEARNINFEGRMRYTPYLHKLYLLDESSGFSNLSKCFLAFLMFISVAADATNIYT